MESDGDADARLDRAFMALADPVRRAIVARLSRGPATVNELAAPFDITKQAVSKHIQVLEQAGLVTRTRDAQRRPVHLDAAALERLTAWIDRYRLDAERSYRRLDALLAGMTDTTQKGNEEMTNALNLNAPVDTLAMEFTREFDAPVRGAVPRARRARTGQAVARPARPRDGDQRVGLQKPWRVPLLALERAREFGFNGTFHTVRENEFILQTFEFEGAPDMVNIEFMWFEDLGNGRSRLRGRSICPNTEARDALLSSGMEGGMTEGYEKLDVHVEIALMDSADDQAFRASSPRRVLGWSIDARDQPSLMPPGSLRELWRVP